MILPSDEDNPFDSSDPSPGQGKNEEDSPTPDVDDFWAALTEDASPQTTDWRDELKAQLIQSIAELRNFPDPDVEFDPPEPPDLFTFFSELMVMRQALQTSRSEAGAHHKKQSEALRRLTEELKSGRKTGGVPAETLKALEALAQELEVAQLDELAARAWAIHRSLGGRRPGKNS